jgi:hypothetical protein
MESDWMKLICLLKYLNRTRKDILRLSADDLKMIKWSVDVVFAVHPDFKSHTGAVMSFKKGALQVISSKQKLNTRSSTKAELMGADDAIMMILWTKQFMEAQGYEVAENILYQDNKSMTLLEENGWKGAGKGSRAINIHYFFLMDQIQQGNVIIRYMPTDDMIGNYMSKLFQGKKFCKFHKFR